MTASSSKLPRLTRATQAFVDALAKQDNPPLYTLTPVEARKVLSNAQAGSTRKRPVDVRDMELPVGPTGRVPVRIVRPAGETGTMPVIFYFHGGGWILGDKDTHDRLVRELAYAAKSVVVFPSYTPSPEARYPVPIEQAYAAMTHVVNHAQTFGIDPTRIAVVGDSVGGNMTIAMTLMAKYRKGPAIHKQLLYYPVTNACFDTGSYRRFAEGYYLYRAGMMWFWNQYAPCERERARITASPLRASPDRLRGLPAAMILNGQADVLRDEGEAFGEKLRCAGVEVTAMRFQGIIHDFVMLNSLDQTDACRAAMDASTAWLNRKNGEALTGRDG